MFKTRWHTSLRFKLTLWAFAPTLIIFGVALLSFAAYQRATEDLAIERNLDLVRVLAAQLATELDGSTRALDTVVQRAGLQNTLPTSSDDLLRMARSSGGGFDAGALLFDPNGTLIAIDPAESFRLGEDWSTLSWFNANSPAFSGVEPLGANANRVAVVTVPIRNDRQQVIGVLGGMFYVPPRNIGTSVYASINRSVLARGNIPEDIVYINSQGRLRPVSELSAPARLFQHTQSLRLGLSESSEIYVVDSSGRAIYHTDRQSIGQDLSDSSIVQQALASSFGAIRTENLAQDQVVASYATVGKTGWHLLAEESWASINAFSYSYRAFLQATLVIGLLLPVLLVNGAMKRMTRIIGQIIEAARQVAGGNFGRVIATETGDELDDLAHQFNAMSNQLQESYGDLEKRVHDRTRDLATLNSIARVTGESLSLQTILGSALTEILEALGFCAAQATIFDPDTAASLILVECGHSLATCDAQETGAQARMLWRDESPANYRPLVMPQPPADGSLGIGPASTVMVPVSSDDRLLGNIVLYSDTDTAVPVEQLELLTAIGRQIGLAVDKALLHNKAQELAVIQERNRLARDLHDSVTQSLYAITFYAQAAERLLQDSQNDRAAEHIRQVGTTSQSAMQEMRLLLLDLRPPDIIRDGLVGALQKRLDAVEGHSGLETRLQVMGQEPQSPALVDALYRIASEALNNALRHAQATRLTVVLDFGSTPRMTIADNGVGFDPSTARLRGGMGLANMRERAASINASLDIQSTPGSGTTVTLEVNG